ncbi:LysR family transcriptional regulator [Oleiagrimonas sp. MCCC 1A03011]|uniref:LysR family transcriptional regulator n=1 Tax=Oleiagrimonas sp. MCCC 1A03011 TaxID=1926883 RepID=UPI000DC2F54D|nr:LysR family transcriptional regulator [Oleiagrimonas sp. MCCC 1A03011]RAP57674.1 LysR family transcriptional regulator [Oleiagrimonas sp. MCCC 1A03011]
MKALADLRLFLSTAELGSLSAAARALDTSPAVASAALKRLEAELEAQLFVRSTRSLRLTLEGERFLQHAREALRSLDEGREALRGDRAELRGELRISAPSDFGHQRLRPWLDTFLQQHPRLQLRLQLSDRLADVYRQPMDVALRYGEPPDSSLIALPLAPDNRRVLCASPDYLARTGTPKSPAELSEHNCLRFLLSDELRTHWRFTAPDGRVCNVGIHGDRVSDDGNVVRGWALDGLGIAYKSWLDVSADVAAKRLVVLCPTWRGDLAPLHLVSPDRRLLSPAVHRLRAFLEERCAAIGPPERTHP